MKVALYARVSTSKQEAENQLRQLRGYAGVHTWEIAGEYVDIITGKEESRPAWDRLFLDAHRLLFEVVLFWDFSRFARSGTLYTLQKLRELENLNITWHSYNEPYVSTAGQFRDVVIAVLASVAKAEREKISDRTKAGLARSPKRHLVGKRGTDKHPRKLRSDRGLKRGIRKNPPSFIKDEEK